MLMGISHIPAAQSYIGAKVSDAVGDVLGTRVSVGRIDLGFLNRIIIDNIQIYDQQRKEMVRVSRLTAKVDIIPLTKGRISISSAQLLGAQIRLYRTSAQSKPNFQFVIDSLASKDTTNHKPLDLRINSFIMRNSSISYDQHDQVQTEGVFNPAHIHFTDLSANINLRRLSEDSLNLNVKRFGFHEQSGLFIDRIQFRLEAGRTHATLSNLLVQMPSSRLKTDTLKADYQTDDKGLVPGSLSFSGKVYETIITPSDLRCFVPLLKNFQTSLKMNLALCLMIQKILLNFLMKIKMHKCLLTLSKKLQASIQDRM